MELAGSLFTTAWLVALGAVLLPGLWLALRWANWRRLAVREQLHVFLGACVFLMLLWTLRTEIQPGFTWHLSGMVALTLMFGWSLALLGGCLSLFGITLAGLNDWGGYVPSAVLHVLLGYVPTYGDEFVIVDNDSNDPVDGLFKDFYGGLVLSEASTFSVGNPAGYSSLLAITYLGGDGNDVVLTAIPEPSTVAMLLGLAGVGLLGWMRRQRRT